MSRIVIFYFILAFAESRLARIDDKEPVAKEKEMTPQSIIMTRSNFSELVSAVISPKPTVVIVVTVK